MEQDVLALGRTGCNSWGLEEGRVILALYCHNLVIWVPVSWLVATHHCLNGLLHQTGLGLGYPLIRCPCCCHNPEIRATVSGLVATLG